MDDNFESADDCVTFRIPIGVKNIESSPEQTAFKKEKIEYNGIKVKGEKIQHEGLKWWWESEIRVEEEIWEGDN